MRWEKGYGDEVIHRLGTFRSAAPATSLLAARQAAKKCGVSRLAGVTGLDYIGIPVWMAVRPLGRSLSVSQGKGLTDTLAQISALMEAIELFHAEIFLPSGIKRSIRRTIGDRAFVNVQELPIRSKKRLDFELPIRWVQTRSIITGKNKWIPKELIDLDSTHPYDGFFVASSNGLASGNSKVEALFHGLCEVVERDQTALWLVAENVPRRPTPRRLKLTTSLPESVERIVHMMQLSGLEVAVWYTSTTVDVPCFACTIADPRGRTLYPQRAAGYGCHVSKEIALLRALTEAAQSRLTFIAGTRDDVFLSHYQGGICMDAIPSKTGRRKMAASREAVSYADLPDFSDLSNFSEAVEFVVSRILEDGIADVFALDLTNAAIGIPVVHVCVPLAEHDVRNEICIPGERLCRFLRAARRS